MGEQPKPGEEAERLYLIGLTHEVAGYRLRQQTLEIRHKIRKDTPAEEVAKLLASAPKHFDPDAPVHERWAPVAGTSTFEDRRIKKFEYGDRDLALMQELMTKQHRKRLHSRNLSSPRSPRTRNAP